MLQLWDWSRRILQKASDVRYQRTPTLNNVSSDCGPQAGNVWDHFGGQAGDVIHDLSIFNVVEGLLGVGDRRFIFIDKHIWKLQNDFDQRGECSDYLLRKICNNRRSLARFNLLYELFSCSSVRLACRNNVAGNFGCNIKKPFGSNYAFQDSAKINWLLILVKSSVSNSRPRRTSFTSLKFMSITIAATQHIYEDHVISLWHIRASPRSGHPAG